VGPVLQSLAPKRRCNEKPAIHAPGSNKS